MRVVGERHPHSLLTYMSSSSTPMPACEAGEGWRAQSSFVENHLFALKNRPSTCGLGLSPGLAEPLGETQYWERKVIVPHLLSFPQLWGEMRLEQFMVGLREVDDTSSWWLFLCIGGCAIHWGLRPALVQLAHCWTWSGKRWRVQRPSWVCTKGQS